MKAFIKKIEHYNNNVYFVEINFFCYIKNYTNILEFSQDIARQVAKYLPILYKDISILHTSTRTMATINENFNKQIILTFQVNIPYIKSNIDKKTKNIKNFEGHDIKLNYNEKIVKNKTASSHYENCKIQPIEYILANNMNFCEGNVIKYISRYKYKNGLEDLKKARHYIDILIEEYNK